jgi:alpha-glucosidase
MKLLTPIALSLAAAMLAPPVLAQDAAAARPNDDAVAKAVSPDGRITLTVSLDNEGRPSYAVQRDGKPIITDSRLGFMFTDAPKIERNLTLADTRRESSDTTWSQPFGEWSSIRDNHNEVRLVFREKADLKREVDVTFRLFDDGVAFRYTLPDQPNLHHANIAEELTQFAFAQGGTAWWKPAFEWNREEYLYSKTALDAVGTAQTVMTVKLADGTHVALHEAALVDYSAMNLARSEGNSFRAVLTPGAGAPKVSRDAGFSTPWRTIAIADDAAGLYANHMILNLNEPNKLGDVSGWIRPGKFVGVWWNMIKNEWTWARGPKHGATTANVRRYIDFAAANGFPGVLVEGWNVGWDGNWFGNGNDMNFSQPTEDFDAAGLAAYAKAKGVSLIGHHETGGSASNYDRQLDSAFKWAADHGEQVVKTGYVTDAGQIERVDADGSQYREWHEGQWMVNHYLRVVQAAAKYKVSIDSHEPVKDTGLRRTYPNWVAREGGRGMEYNAWEGAKNPPEHEANMVFTQFLGGPMDFTPGVLSLTGVNGSTIKSTIAKQLALYVVLYSPVVMAADTPENYAKYPGPFQFIKDVPTDWSDTRVLNGEVGDYATIARKAKGSNDWYLGAIGDEEARSSEVTLDFLDAGRSYTAEIYRDGLGADYRTDARHAIVIEKRPVKKGDRLAIALAPGGGEAIRFVAAGGRAGKR